jgi:UPF0271 protein
VERLVATPLTVAFCGFAPGFAYMRGLPEEWALPRLAAPRPRSGRRRRRVRYVKPHGALYNTAAIEEGQASAVVAAVRSYHAMLPVLCQPGSVLARLAADQGLTVVGEGFADRGYRTNGTLAPRSAEGALIHDPDAVVPRAVRMAVDGVVETAAGEVVACEVASICVHGDPPARWAWPVESEPVCWPRAERSRRSSRTGPCPAGSAGDGPARPA